MQRTKWVQRVMASILSISAVVLLLSAGVPHAHVDVDASVALDSDDSCYACQLVDGLSATPPVLHVIHVLPTAWVEYDLIYQDEVPRAAIVVRATAPRAPPVFTSA